MPKPSSLLYDLMTAPCGLPPPAFCIACFNAFEQGQEAHLITAMNKTIQNNRLVLPGDKFYVHLECWEAS